jgi:hypothetical protein
MSTDRSRVCHLSFGDFDAAGSISVKQAQSEIQYYCATGIVP